MIPGYPNFFVKLIGYDVTLNSTITETDGTQHQKDKTWNTDTEDTTSTTEEFNWEVSEEVSCSLTNLFGVSVSVSCSGSETDTHTTGTVKSNGGNIMDSTQWSLAICSNPSEAAKIKLTLQAKNVGTCVAKDVQLTMNLKIGGKKVRTIYMENTIGTLEVGGTYEWVAGSGEDILLTYDELRSLETGASVAVEVAGVSAKVVRKVDGEWVIVGDWADYTGEANAICAHIFLDLGDGNTTEHLVYADDSESAPEVILKDAIIWAANGQDDPALGPVVRFYQTDGSLGPAKPLNDWYFSLDEPTYIRIKGDIKNPDFNLFDTVLGPNTIIVAKAPPIEDWPKIRWATLSPRHDKVIAYVDDYFFNQSPKEEVYYLDVYFVDKYDDWQRMTWDVDKRCFFCTCPDDYVKEGTEKIVARNALYDPDKPDTWKWQTEMQASEMRYVPGFKNAFVGSYDTPDNAVDLFVSGDYAYVADMNSGLQVIDISDPANPSLEGSYDTPGSAQGAFVSGDYAYVADGGSGLRVINISTPESPSLEGSYDTPGPASGVFVSGDYAYVADGGSGLRVININNPKTPSSVGSCDTTGHAVDVFVSGNYAYVADRGSGLQVIDISDPASPSYKVSYYTGGNAIGVVVSGNYAYVADSYSGLQVIDISDPANPSYKNSYNTGGGYTADVFVSGNYAYVADMNFGLFVIDISDPASLSLEGSYNTGGFPSGVFVSGDYAYVADWNGLSVIGFR